MDGEPGYGIQGEFNLTLVEDGILPASMVFGLMLAAPAAAQLRRAAPPLRLMGCGFLLWAAAAATCAAAPSYGVLLAARLAIGVGVGPFIALASPLVDDAAPRDKKSLWLSLLFLCIPVGFALGYVYGGLVGSAYGWRTAFAFEAAAMLPLAALTLLAPPVELRGAKPVAEGAAGASKSALAHLAADCRQLARSPVALLTILALSVYNGALGCYAFYGPKAARDIFALPPQKADLLFGGVTVVTGVLGTLAGGLSLDALGNSVRNALLLCTAGVGVGCALILAGFAAARTLAQFGPAFALGEFGMFLLAAPVNAVLLWSVSAELRPFALSAAEFSQHLLGDIPAPPLLGLLQSRLGDWRASMSAVTGLLAVAVALFAVALCHAGGAADASARQVLAVEGELLADGQEVGGERDSERGGAAAAVAGQDLTEPLLSAAPA
ncbi:putative sphingolipid transporter spinster-like protein 2 [Micractinium conductrix]|uniref:Sphingolipid transporter spinster-like protein 2 n=1 Tax=Micractinium conductrix TaxID=554055 RepID=A0A2P6V319_9CHLO|nr:putative sphingolipid transporter spinster-like protein 2 [Micractinium conductrix]|eukprot:PSC68467.1 putative sphingolipid transporter spinster-like protein 2 [Micractinium conductrix]